MAIEIRFATPEDADRCNEFHNRCYGSNRTASQWKWEFCSHPHKGRVVPFVLAEVNGRVVGTQALIPIAMIDAEEVFWTAKLEETLVDPAYRRYQVFIQMYEKLFRYAEEHGLVSIWGFTEIPQVFEGLLGFQIPANTQQLFRPLRRSSVSQLLEQYLGQDRQKRPRVLRGPGEPLCAAAATFGSSLIAGLRGWRPVVRGLELETLRDAPDLGASLSARFVRQWGGATINRDQPYLRWRLFENPYVRSTVRAASLDGQLVGWVAYALDDSSMGYLVDLFVATEEADPRLAEKVTRVLLFDAVDRLRKAGTAGIRSWHLNDHPYEKALLRATSAAGFFRINRGSGGMVVCPHLDVVGRPSLRSFDNWFVSRLYSEGLLG